MFTPCNEMNTTAMVKEAKKVAKKMASELGIMRNIIREGLVEDFIGGVSRLPQAPRP